MVRFLSAFILFLFAGQLIGQNLLWKISGKGIQEPSYLYGTIHITDKRVFSFDSTVTKAFHSCDALALEMVMDQIKKEDVEANMLMKTGTLKDLYTPEEWEFTDKAFKEKTGSSLMLFMKMKPFFVYSQLLQSGMSKDMPEALDMYLLKEYRAKNKPVLGIEVLADQLGAIDQIELKEQAKMLYNALKDTTTNTDQFDGLIDVYLNQDIDKMLEMMNDTTLPEKFNQAFLVGRNVKMAENIAKYSKKQKVFNAIGAAHLPGEKGVIALLRKKGYTVEPVPFKFVPEAVLEE
ncbi:MAG: hypothetical protein CVU05_09490 [Bacteroidetes bacterium HGW-Bacteroidetes-21]|jgi:hypothetical protein|nr:MAG: hypothetical protein CVU05_09490 [Bacteroidetes bacterium HGW-Bacteroidetes-21]